jgi:hypothetical protein
MRMWESLIMNEIFNAKLAAMDLEPIIFLLTSSEGHQWTLKQARLAEKWYRRFHELIHRYPSRTLVPTKTIDEVWHFHILDTQKYFDDCMELHGHIVHHFPYFGVRSRDDKVALTDSYRETVQLFASEYGESPEQIEGLFGRGGTGAAVVCDRILPGTFHERPRLAHSL